MQTIKDSIKTIAVSLVAISLISVAYAWTEPTSNPPSGNTNPPITTASTTQTKTGWLTLDNFETYGNTYLATVTGNVGIGTTDPGAKLEVNGDIKSLRWGPKYTTWSGIGDGGAAIVNSNEAAYKALMIVGSDQSTGAGRVVKVWDNLQVQGPLSATSGSFSSVCINSDCRTGWPSSTTYTAGTGISISGTTITNTGDTNASDDITSLSAGQGISISGTGNSRTINSKFQCRCDSNRGAPVACGIAQVTATLPSGFFRTGGGCYEMSGNERQIVQSSPTDTSSWHCQSVDEDNCKAGRVIAYVCGCSTN